MARTAALNKQQIIDTAFNIVNENGFDALTIRSIAKELGTSTAPIYTQYENMDDLQKDLYETVLERVDQSLVNNLTPNLFLNIGSGLINFVLNNRKIYTHYFFSPSSFNQRMRDATMKYIDYMRQDLFLSLLKVEQLESIMDDMLTYTFGLISILCTSNQPENLDYYIKKLEETGNKIIYYHIFTSGKLEDCFRIIANQQHQHFKENK